MRRVLLLVMLLFAASISANAQDHPKFEAWGTYSIFIADIAVLDNETLHGYGLGIQGNLNKYFGVVAEFTSNHGASGPVTISVPGRIHIIPELDTRVNTFLFGPRLSYRAKAVTAFAHFLAGGANAKLRDEKGTSGFEDGNTEFAMGIGGGLDVNLGKHYAIRAAQFDFLPIHTDVNERLSGAPAVGFTIRAFRPASYSSGDRVPDDLRIKAVGCVAGKAHISSQRRVSVKEENKEALNEIAT